MRVLLVEDDSLVARTVTMALVAFGHEVVSVATYDDARRRIATGEDDVVVTDFDLGGGETGIDVCARCAERIPRLGVVLYSGALDAALCERAYAAGAGVCLRKPFDVDALARAVDAAVERARLGASQLAAEPFTDDLAKDPPRR